MPKQPKGLELEPPIELGDGDPGFTIDLSERYKALKAAIAKSQKQDNKKNPKWKGE